MKHHHCRPLIRLLLPAVLALGCCAHAMAPKYQYQYGEMWWEEYEADARTTLLLHCGPPTRTAARELAVAVEQRRQADEDPTAALQTPNEAGTTRELTDALGKEGAVNLDAGPPPVDESKLPPGSLADYSPARRTVKLGPTQRLVPEGRFGQGLRLEPGPALVIPFKGGAMTAECWFRVERYPAAEACLFASGKDELRLLLRPDGRLELRLKHPHGTPDAKKLGEIGVKSVLARNADIVSPQPMALNRWIHVSVNDVDHPAPCNTSPFDAQLRVDGEVVAKYLSEGGNQYRILGAGEFCLGNSSAGDQPFAGIIDELRVSSNGRDFYERPALPWRDPDSQRPLAFNRPIVSLQSPDWINSTSRTAFEVVQNAGLWGVNSFYMPFIAEGGFADKARSQFPRWQWRMARQAQSQFAHYETAAIYPNQGEEVFRAYWKDLLDWGAGDARTVTFHPYWSNRRLLEVAGQGGDTLVSCYRAPGRLLLIASNRLSRDSQLQIKLNLAELGLKPGLTLRELDAGRNPPPGQDYTTSKELAAEVSKVMETSMDVSAGVEPDPVLAVDLDAEETAKAQAQASEPRLDGNVLTLGVRARDYRVISLEGGN